MSWLMQWAEHFNQIKILLIGASMGVCTFQPICSQYPFETQTLKYWLPIFKFRIINHVRTKKLSRVQSSATQNS